MGRSELRHGTTSLRQAVEWIPVELDDGRHPRAINGVIGPAAETPGSAIWTTILAPAMMQGREYRPLPFMRCSRVFGARSDFVPGAFGCENPVRKTRKKHQ